MESQLLGNRYELIEKIGGGGMAVVYKAKCLLLNRYVAVKILRDEFTGDEEFVDRFRVEAQAAASLSHPNIVQIFDVGREKGIHYIVMEYVDGITLKEYISQIGPLPWREAVGIAIQICSAIEQAHKKQIVHRDIKPHNILLTKEGIAKVTDFGIARAVNSATITMAGSTIGSVHYFSPEQARGSYTNEKSDLYSLGITIYEMVTGRVPFDGESPVAIALKHIQEKAEYPAVVNPSVPKGVNDLIVKAIKKDQNFRYQNASELLTDLQRTLGEPNARISGSRIIENLPTKRMKAVGAGIGVIEYDMSEGHDESEDDIGDMMVYKRKKDRLSVWLGIITGLVIVGILFYIGLTMIIPALIPAETEEYTVLDYTNKNFDDVLIELSSHDIQAVESDWVFSDTVDRNIIISQDVAVGNKLKPGNTIGFKVSKGPEMVEIPDITSEESRKAIQMIKNLELEPEEINEYNEEVPTGHVIRTEPAAFEMVRPKESVTIFVSLGPELEKIIMPELVGKTRAEAERLIEENKLTIGDIIPADVVSDIAVIVKQYPIAGSEVDEGTAVEMTFEIDGGTGDPDGPGSEGTDTPEGPGGGAHNGEEGNSPRTVLLNIRLEETQSYGEEVLVYVEITPSDTNKIQVVFNRNVPKKSFPFSIPITLSKKGTTHIVVKLDGILVQEGDK